MRKDLGKGTGWKTSQTCSECGGAGASKIVLTTDLEAQRSRWTEDDTSGGKTVESLQLTTLATITTLLVKRRGKERNVHM